MCPGPSACVMMTGMPANMRFQAPLSDMVVIFVAASLQSNTWCAKWTLSAGRTHFPMPGFSVQILECVLVPGM
jgi:hypothetical protein